MKKIFLLSLITIRMTINLFSQAITPVQSTEQCPNANITFTVTIAANSIQSVQPKALNVNPTVVQQPFNISTSGANKIFNFIGKFADYNNKQTFTVYYTNTSGQAATWDATFIKIKSLLTPNSFSQIFPTPTIITAQRCQIQNFNINFANVKYGNPWETPPVGYGTVTNYQYLLPNAWKLGTTPSDGTTWLNGSSNVTITSGLSTGDGTNIRIRPVNTACGTGLVAGQESYVAISRPAPNLTITATQSYICTTGGTTNLTLNNIPSGATVTWSIVYPPGQAQIVGCTTCATATLQRIGTDNVITTIKATVLHCSFTYEKTFNVTLGTPPNGIITPYLNYCLGGSDWELGLQASSPDPTVTQYLWSRDGVPAGSGSTWYTYEFPPSCMTIGLKAGNACGFSPEGTQVFCPPCSYRMAISPNPAKDQLNVILENSFLEKKNILNNIVLFKLIRVDNPQFIRQWSFKRIQKNYSLNLNGLKKGIYTLELSTGDEKETKQVVIID